MIRPQTCAVCDKELPPGASTDSPLFPFCSRRCQQIDLLRWCEGKHAITEHLTPDRLVQELSGEAPDESA